MKGAFVFFSLLSIMIGGILILIGYQTNAIFMALTSITYALIELRFKDI